MVVCIHVYHALVGASTLLGLSMMHDAYALCVRSAHAAGGWQVVTGKLLVAGKRGSAAYLRAALVCLMPVALAALSAMAAYHAGPVGEDTGTCRR